jgi:hypothetical protein
MHDTNREIHELFADYAGALRDGCLPSFLKSLTRKETQRIVASSEFWDAADVVHALNGVAFADKAKTSNVSLFIERVDAEIASRMRKSKAPPSAKHSAQRWPVAGTK